MCMQHFKSEDIENNLKYEMGYCRKRILKQDAVPTIDNEKSKRQEYKKIVDELLLEYEETLKSTSSVGLTKCDINAACNTTFMQNNNSQPIGLINEALFDKEEISTQQSTFASDADNADSPFSPLIEIKSEDDETEDTVDTSFPFNSKSTQTDEAAKDRINCGFVNVSKTGLDKFFNLRCFYCDAEYPITFWSEFSDHILYNHGHLEKAYEKKDALTSSNKSEHNISEKMDLTDSTDSATEGEETEELSSINYVNLNIKENEKTKIAKVNNSKQDLELINILAQGLDSSDSEDQYMSVNKYVPNLDHSYSQYDLNVSLKEAVFNDFAPIDEICFAKTPHKIVLDFLEHLKGFPSLWHDRKIDCEKYDNELLELLNIIHIKWSLNLRMDYLRKNVENIKAWFYSIKAEEEKHTNHTYDQEIFDEYYIKCSEFLNIGIDIKYNIPCDLCNRTFANVLLLLTHKHRRHKIGQRPYKCSKCVRRFAHLHSLISHVKRHATKQSNIKKKKIIVKQPTNLACFECKQKFVSEYEYKNHLDIHPKGDCPYACEECGKRYKSHLIRNIHQKKHNLTNYQCELCPSKLSSTYTFRIHMLAHKGIYEFICEHCGQGFVSNKYLIEHRKYSHLGYGICKICNREYKKRRILQKHLRDRHKPTFGTNEYLSKPRRKITSIGCNLKNRKYEYITDPVTQVKRIKCPKCDKSFRQNRNVLLHAMKIHNFDARTMLRSGQRLKQQKSLESPNFNKVETLNDKRNDESTLAVSTITECSEAKLEISYNHEINSGNYDFIEINDENQEEKYANGILFTTDDNLHLHSSSDLLDMDGGGQASENEDAPLKVEVLESGSYEFILSDV